MAQPTIAPRTPVACATCGGQYPDRTHIDYASAWEGPPVADTPRAPLINWIVICEKCLRDGVALLPPSPQTLQAIEERANEIADARTAALEERLAAAEAYADGLEDAFSRRPAERAERAPRATARGGATKAPRKNRYEKAEA